MSDPINNLHVNALPTEDFFSKGAYIYIAYTVKRLGEKYDCDTLFRLWNRLGIMLVLRQSEYDSHEKLHYHGIIRVPKNFLLKRLQTPSYHIYTKPIQTYADYKRWRAYCLKTNKPNNVS